MPRLQKKKKAQKKQTVKYQPFWRFVYGLHCPVKQPYVSLLDKFVEQEHEDSYPVKPVLWRLAEADERALDIYKEYSKSLDFQGTFCCFLLEFTIKIIIMVLSLCKFVQFSS